MPDRNFSFDFMGVSLTTPKRVRFQYMLEGVDRDQLRKAVVAGLQNQDGRSRGTIGTVFRVIPLKIQSVEQLGLQLFKLFPSPFLRALFLRQDKPRRWQLQSIEAIPARKALSSFCPASAARSASVMIPAVIGSEEEVGQFVQAYADAGVEHPVLMPMPWGEDRFGVTSATMRAAINGLAGR